jgi:hypothetical protein
MLEDDNGRDSGEFSRYEKMSSYPLKKQGSVIMVTAKKIDLKLPMPHFLQQSSSAKDALNEQESGLPAIRKPPVSFLRNS